MTESQYILESSNKYSQCLPTIANDFFPKPTTKLEQIENIILIPSTSDTTFINTNASHLNNINNSNAICNSNTNNIILSSTNNINTLLSNNSSNNLFDADNKIISLQRSISDKLRNSFKTNSNKINTSNVVSNNTTNNNSTQKNANSSYPILTLTRKWHSERHKNRKVQLNFNNVNNSQNNDSNNNNNNANKLSFKFSSQMNPLNSHYKALLAQYTSKNKSIICNNIHKNKPNNLNPKPAKSLEIQSKNKTLFGLTKSANKSSENNNKIKVLLTGKDKETNNNNNNNSNINHNHNSFLSSKTSSNSCNKSSNSKKLFNKKLKNNSSKNNMSYENSNDFAGMNQVNLTNDYLDDSGGLNGLDEDEEDSTTDDEEFNYLLKKINHRHHYHMPHRHNHFYHHNHDHTVDSSDDSDQDDYFYMYNHKSRRLNNLKRSHSYSMGDKNKNSLLLDSSNHVSVGINISDKPMSSKASNQTDYLNHHDTLANAGLIARRLTSNEPDDFYEKVTTQKYECQICFDKVYLNERLCCKFRACNNCVNYYIETKIKNSCGLVKIECLNTKCTKLIHRDEICERMSHHDKNTLKNYLKYLVEANKDSNCKTCPRCSHIMRLDDYKLKTVTSTANSNEKGRSSSFSGISLKMSKSKNKLTTKNSSILTKVQCIECQLIWCFQCHAPWHDGITCNEFRKGDRMLKYWAKEVHFGQQNAQLCPKCKIYIQRTKGCDHMVCTYCQTEFCYKCGGKFRRFKFIGDHYSKLSVLGCKYRFYPEKPAKRKLIRSSILGVKLLAAPLVASVGLVVGLGALAVGCVALPIYGSYKLINHFRVSHSYRSNSIRLIKVSEIADNSLFTSLDDNNLLHRYKLDSLSINNNLSSIAITSNFLNNDNNTGAALNLIPREASRNQKLINMINNDIDKFNNTKSNSESIANLKNVNKANDTFNDNNNKNSVEPNNSRRNSIDQTKNIEN